MVVKIRPLWLSGWASTLIQPHSSFTLRQNAAHNHSQVPLCPSCVLLIRGSHVKVERGPTRRETSIWKQLVTWGEPRVTPDVDSHLAAQHWILTCQPRPAGWESTCVCLPPECRETVSDPSGRWISSLQLPVPTGQQTAVPPGSRQVQDHQATKTSPHLRQQPDSLHIPDVIAFFWTRAQLAGFIRCGLCSSFWTQNYICWKVWVKEGTKQCWWQSKSKRGAP